VCSAADASIRIGIFDPAFLNGESVAVGAFDRSRASGSAVVRVQISWPSTALQEPANPSDPQDAAYRWSGSDLAVREARARGLRVILSFSGAPAWAEGRNRPSRIAAGAWKPDVRAIGDFARALARRYRGQVQDFQLWNEPNLDKYLAPQWIKIGPHRYKPFAPGHYRKMLNAAYGAIKAVSSGNRLITAGTAPYGDPQPGGGRTMPARFWRGVLCLDPRLTKTPCARPAHFDVLAHHPYAVGGPRRRALNADDVAVPDMGKLTRILAAARRHRTALPARAKPLWVTEISWDSDPPDPYGVPAKRHAAWLSDALYTLWKQHVRTVLWFRVVDQAPIPSYATTNQSGLYLRDGTPKLAQKAFAFPVACERTSGSGFRVWGMAPVASAQADVQVRRDGIWRTVATRRAGTDRVFTFRGRGSAMLVRAVQGTATSLGCAVRR
jgi:hypothetical protein